MVEVDSIRAGDRATIISDCWTWLEDRSSHRRFVERPCNASPGPSLAVPPFTNMGFSVGFLIALPFRGISRLSQFGP